MDALESKVENLLAQIASLNRHGESSSSGLPSVEATTTSMSSLSPEDECDLEPAVVSVTRTGLTGVAGPVAMPSYALDPSRFGPADVVDRGLLSMADARALVDSFRHDFAPHFPFVALAPHETADRLRQDSPLLFLCVVTTAAYADPALQKALAAEVGVRVTARLMLGVERSLDLLRGMLVQAAWYHYFAERRRSQLFMVSQMCVALAHDLELDRRQGLTADQKRAMLGTYWLSVV